MTGRVRAHRPVNPEILEFDPALVLRLCDDAAKQYLHEQPELRRKVKRIMREVWNTELSQTQRRYLLLYYQQACTMREIAVLCGVTTPTVSRTLSRARNRMRRVLQYYLSE